MADTAVAVSKASEYQQWFHETVTQADADPLDANADENLHQLHEQLHGDEPATVLGGRAGACLHIFPDGSVFCCHCLRELQQAELVDVIVKH